MVRGAKEVGNGQPNPEAEERRRLKKLAFAKDILSEAPAKACTALSPSKTVTKHHGRDILRKSQRKNRFLFSFPGLLAPISGGKIGELKDLGTKNPILYLHFPQGQMKLFGSIVYPKNRYLTLQFSRGGKNVMCEDYFDTMIVFSDAWWIGRKDENPEEARLEFPKELTEGQHAEFDFKGGAGATSEQKQGVNRTATKGVEQKSPKTEIEDLSDGQNNVKDVIEVTPTRHSERTAGKTFKFAEFSSGDDSIKSEADASEGEEKKLGAEHPIRNYTPVFDIDNEDAAVHTHFSGKVQQSAMSVTKPKEPTCSNHSSLVQATISTLFKKVEEKKAPRNLRKSPSSKVSGQNLQHDPKWKSDQVKAEGPRKKRKVIEERKTGTQSTARSKQLEDEDDDIDEFSSTSKDTDGSDEDWAA
uniref:Putative DNA-binding protein RHL1 n=1 Tax=Davidia involucrata TaxID=16924 RepID=A0A5B7CAR4_DAVIN